MMTQYNRVRDRLMLFFQLSRPLYVYVALLFSVFISLSLYKFMLHKSKNNYMIAYIILGKTRNCIKINALCLVYSNTTCKLSSFSDAYETIDCIPFSPKTRENSCHQISKVLVQLVYLLHQSRIDN